MKNKIGVQSTLLRAAIATRNFKYRETKDRYVYSAKASGTADWPKKFAARVICTVWLMYGLFGGPMLIVAVNGNIEQMINKGSGRPLTAHATNFVPLVYAEGDKPLNKWVGLSDLATTMMAMLGGRQLVEISGRSLFQPS